MSDMKTLAQEIVRSIECIDLEWEGDEAVDHVLQELTKAHNRGMEEAAKVRAVNVGNHCCSRCHTRAQNEMEAAIREKIK